jgi:hypothetical protein
MIKLKEVHQIMLLFGIPKKPIRLTKVTIEDSAFQVNIQTEPTTRRNGLKQGDWLAPLFSI